MRRAIRSADELRRRLRLPPACDVVAKAESAFSTFVPLEFLSRIQPQSPSDPLLRQVLPTAMEMDVRPGFVSDPVADRASHVGGGLLQKYRRRSLLITTGVCGVHCRYCFRREFDYSARDDDEAGIGDEAGADDASTGRWDAALRHLRRDDSIDEVILSGGDPLTIDDEKLARLIGQLESIPTIKRLRLHSRMPIVIPQRVTGPLVERLRQSRLACWVVIHCNHPQELDHPTLGSLARLIDAGLPVLNQAVLLSGVNDSVDILEALCRKLIDHRVQPYYLHQLDRVAGAGHFEVSVERGAAIVAELRRRLPGYGVPQYVAEIAGMSHKQPIP